MKTEQINIRLRSDLAAALDRVAREEALDRATAIRRLLETSIKQWELEHALRGYRTGELSVGRAAEEACSRALAPEPRTRRSPAPATGSPTSSSARPSRQPSSPAPSSRVGCAHSREASARRARPA